MKTVLCGVVAAILILLNGCSSEFKRGPEPAPVIRPQKGAELCDEVALKLGPRDMDCPFAYPVPVSSDHTIECGQDFCGCPQELHTGCITFDKWCIEQHANGVFWNTTCIMEKVMACGEVETLCNTQ